MKIVAVAPVGREYLYRASTAHAVPVSSAEKIRSALNAALYNLRDGETWHLYDVGPYDDAAVYANYQRCSVRSGRVLIRG